jgi:hypothetical protein
MLPDVDDVTCERVAGRCTNARNSTFAYCSNGLDSAELIRPRPLLQMDNASVVTAGN